MAEITKTIKPGGTPGSDCDYTSISAALAANCGLASKDLVSQTTSVTLNCVAGTGVDTSNVNTTGWTCDSTYNLTIRGYDTGKHAGKYDASKYVIRPASGNVVSLDAAYDVVEDLILDLQNTTSYGCGVKIGATSNLTHYVRRCIIRKSGTGANQRGVDAATAGNVVLLEHCVVYGQSGKALTYGALVGQNSCTLRVYNTTLHNCNTGLWAYSGYAHFYNCLGANCATCFSGNGGTNCASTDATATTYKNITPSFADAANEDFHVGTNSWSGTNITTLSPAGVALDIDGQTVTTWLVGADSVPGAAPSGSSYSDSLAESASSSDAQSASVSLSASASEAMSISDALAAVLSALDGLAEPVAASESASASLSVTASAAEDALIADSCSALSGAALSVSEFGSVSDALGWSLAAVATISESHAATDSSSSAAAFLGAVAEASGAGDAAVSSGTSPQESGQREYHAACVVIVNEFMAKAIFAEERRAVAVIH